MSQLLAREARIVELAAWLQSARGRYLLAWEQDRLDHGVADAFGFHALQLGLPELDGLRANRMPHRWVASDVLLDPEPLPSPPPRADISTTQLDGKRVHLRSEFDSLPFAAASLDLVVMPHSLELARDPHLTLREVERVLMPEGRLLITGFNPISLWRLRQRLAWRRETPDPFLPRAGEFIGQGRLRDWLRLLGFEVEIGRFGGWRPPLRTEHWLRRWAWMDRAGERWWPLLGAVYYLQAVKRVRGMRLVGLARRERRLATASARPVAQRLPVPASELSES